MPGNIDRKGGVIEAPSFNVVGSGTTRNISHGSGSPESVVTASQGSLWMDSNGALWVKATGAGTNTGWVNFRALATTSVQGDMSSTDKTKLDGIATGATANSSDATLLNRANHTSTQAPSTIQVSATSLILGRITALAGPAEELTAANVKTILALVAGDITTGTFVAGVMPAFTGDATSTAGTVALTLASVGTAGTYTKVTTDAKGRVTSGTSLVAADIPALPSLDITKSSSLSAIITMEIGP